MGLVKNVSEDGSVRLSVTVESPLDVQTRNDALEFESGTESAGSMRHMFRLLRDASYGEKIGSQPDFEERVEAVNEALASHQGVINKAIEIYSSMTKKQLVEADAAARVITEDPSGVGNRSLQFLQKVKYKISSDSRKAGEERYEWEILGSILDAVASHLDKSGGVNIEKGN